MVHGRERFSPPDVCLSTNGTQPLVHCLADAALQKDALDLRPYRCERGDGSASFSHVGRKFILVVLVCLLWSDLHSGAEAEIDEVEHFYLAPKVFVEISLRQAILLQQLLPRRVVGCRITLGTQLYVELLQALAYNVGIDCGVRFSYLAVKKSGINKPIESFVTLLQCDVCERRAFEQGLDADFLLDITPENRSAVHRGNHAIHVLRLRESRTEQNRYEGQRSHQYACPILKNTMKRFVCVV